MGRDREVTKCSTKYSAGLGEQLQVPFATERKVEHMLRLLVKQHGRVISERWGEEGEEHGSRRVLLEQGMKSWEQCVSRGVSDHPRRAVVSPQI